MSQKVSPLIFRSKLYPYYKNIWQISKYFNYSYNIYIYLYIKDILKNLIDNLEILGIRLKFINKFYIQINIILPKTLYQYNLNNKISIKYLNSIIKKSTLNKLNKLNFISKYKFSINFYILKQPLLNPEFLNYFIKTQLIKKEPLKKILKQIFQVILLEKNYSIKGIKILISGRINGIQRARKEILKIGNIPLQNLNYNIKYNYNYIKTSFGLVGIKLWLFIY